VLRRVLIDARNEVAAVLDRTTLATALGGSSQSQFAAAVLTDKSPISAG
jgi:hypothetical protein